MINTHISNINLIIESLELVIIHESTVFVFNVQLDVPFVFLENANTIFGTILFEDGVLFVLFYLHYTIVPPWVIKEQSK